MDPFFSDIAALQAEAADILAPARFKVVGRPRFALAALARSFRPAARHVAVALAESIPLSRQLDAIDQKLVQRLGDQGYLLTRPEVTNNLQGRTLFSKYGQDFGISSLGWSGVVKLYPGLEGDMEFLSGHGGQKLTQKALARWLVVLHEVAHAEFSQIIEPFAPPPDPHLAPFLQPLRHWVFSKLNDQSYPLTTLNECFADVYSCMMLLEMTSHDYQAEACVKRMMVKREILREDLEYTGHGECHTTDFALQAMWEQRDTWRGKPAGELKSLAREYASGAVLKLYDTSRTAKNGAVPIGKILRQVACKPKLSLIGLTLEQLSALAGGVDNRTLLRQQLEGHPLAEDCAAFMDDLHDFCSQRPAVFKSAQKNILKDGRLGFKAAQRLGPILDAHEKHIQNKAHALGFDAPLKVFAGVSDSSLSPPDPDAVSPDARPPARPFQVRPHR